MENYKFKAHLFCGTENMDSSNIKALNDLFDKGWEYVESFNQRLSYAGTYLRRSPVVTILKMHKEKQSLTV